ncbi:MAG TPA: hypothetical protein VF546_13960 [Pyrinomonadaceae bacterium]|jgi:hypothetical protein
MPQTEPLAHLLEPTWSEFPPELGSLNVPRASMPQIKSEHRGALVQFLKGRGITHTREDVAPDSLRPAQLEFSPEKVARARSFEGPQRAILVSSDDHVLDGHHQWLAARADAPQTPYPAIRLDAPIHQLLVEVARFPSAGVDKASAGSTQQSPAPARPEPPPVDPLAHLLEPPAPPPAAPAAPRVRRPARPTKLVDVPPVDARLDDFVNQVMAEASRRTGYTYKLGEGSRTPAQQAEKVARGVSWTYNSAHLDGRGRDVLAFDERGNYIPDGSHAAYKALGDVYAEMAHAAPAPVKWGVVIDGQQRDPGHFELAHGHGAQAAPAPDPLAHLLEPAAPADPLAHLVEKRDEDLTDAQRLDPWRFSPFPREDVGAVERVEAAVDRETGRPLALDDPRRGLAPVEFTKGDQFDNVSDATRAAVGLANFARNRPKSPAAFDVGQPITVAVPAGQTDAETAVLLDDAVLHALGPRALAAGRQYRQETGRNFTQPDRSFAELVRAGDAVRSGGHYVVTVRPQRYVIDLLNAYAEGGLEAARRKAAEIQQQADEYDARAERAAQAAGPVRRGVADVGQTQMRVARDVVSAVQLMGARPVFGQPGREFDEEAKADAREQEVFNAAQAAAPAETTGAGAAVRGAINLAGSFPVYTLAGEAAPLLMAAQHMREGPEAMIREGVTGVVTQGAGRVVNAALPAASSLPGRFARNVAARTAQGGAMAAQGATTPEGRTGRGALANFASGFVLPVGKAEEGAPHPADITRLGLSPEHGPVTLHWTHEGAPMSGVARKMTGREREDLARQGHDPDEFVIVETEDGPAALHKGAVEHFEVAPAAPLVDRASSVPPEPEPQALRWRDSDGTPYEGTARTMAGPERRAIRAAGERPGDYVAADTDGQFVQVHRDLIEQSPADQVAELREGRRAVVHVPAEVNRDPAHKIVVPRGMRSFETPERGRIMYNPEMVERADVIRAMDDGTLEDLARPTPERARQAQAAARYEGGRQARGVARTVLDVLQLPKAKAGFDLSATGRQGFAQALAHPTYFLRSLRQQVRSMRSEEAHAEFVESVTSRPDYQQMKDAGLDLSLMGRPEEPFASGLAPRIPGVRASDRAYSAGLDAIRVAAWDNYTAAVRGKPNTTEATYKAIADLINISTGRGRVAGLDRSALGRKIIDALNVPFFSPRNTASKFNLVSPLRVVRNALSAETQPVAYLQLRDAARGLATLGTTMGLMHVAGLNVGLNPFDSRFGKLTVGKVTYDLTGGESFTVRYMAQMARTFRRMEQGKKVDEKFTPAALTRRYLRSQLQPAAGVAVDAKTGETFDGRPFTYSRAAADLAVPFVVMDTYEGFKAEGLLGAGKTLPAGVLGVATRTDTQKRTY